MTTETYVYSDTHGLEAPLVLGDLPHDKVACKGFHKGEKTELYTEGEAEDARWITLSDRGERLVPIQCPWDCQIDGEPGWHLLVGEQAKQWNALRPPKRASSFHRPGHRERKKSHFKK